MRDWSVHSYYIEKLRSEEREHIVDSAWFLNGHIFVLGKRAQTFQLGVTDDIDTYWLYSLEMTTEQYTNVTSAQRQGIPTNLCFQR